MTHKRVPKLDRVCEFCQTEFRTAYPFKKFCSKPCQTRNAQGAKPKPPKLSPDIARRLEPKPCYFCRALVHPDGTGGGEICPACEARGFAPIKTAVRHGR